MLLGQEAVGAEGLAESEKRAVAERGEQVQTGCAPSPCLLKEKAVSEPAPPAGRCWCTICPCPAARNA